MLRRTCPAPPALKRGIRFRDLVPLYVVIVLSVRWTATAAAAGPSILVIWFAALTCFFIPLAACVMELSSRHPGEGGIYIWTREAFGDFSGFICAWTYWMSNLPYFPALLYFGAGSVLFAFGRMAQTLECESAVLHGFCDNRAGPHYAAQHCWRQRGQMAQQHRRFRHHPFSLAAAADGHGVLLAIWLHRRTSRPQTWFLTGR